MAPWQDEYGLDRCEEEDGGELDGNNDKEGDDDW